MQEFQLTVYESMPIATWDFDSLKAQLEQALSFFDGLVYTDESIKSAKDDRSRLKKLKDVFETARKDYKKQCLAPYEAVEAKVKELTGLIDRQISAADAAVKDYEARAREEKEKEVRAFYDLKAKPLGDLAEMLYPVIRDPKWFNASTQKSVYEKDILFKINAVLQDIRAIRELASPYEATLLEVYAATGSLEKAKEKDAELRASVEKAGIAPPQAEAPAMQTAAPEKRDGETVLSLKATPWQFARIEDFLRALGVEFEVQ